MLGADVPHSATLGRHSTTPGPPPQASDAACLARGSGIAEAAGGEPDIILIGTGSEVALCLAAREMLANEGGDARVVSMPSWELFEGQSEEYRRQVLPADVPKLAVEAGATLGWHKYVGSDGDVIGLDRFGASAPGGVVMEKLGFSVENVVKRAVALLERSGV